MGISLFCRRAATKSRMPAERRTFFQGPLGGLLDYRAVGGRVGKRHPDLEDINARFLEGQGYFLCLASFPGRPP